MESTRKRTYKITPAPPYPGPFSKKDVQYGDNDSYGCNDYYIGDDDDNIESNNNY